MDNNNTIILGHRLLFHPRLRLDKTHTDVILWTVNVPLEDIEFVLVGPFNFATKSNTIRPNQYIDRNVWETVAAACIKTGVIVPTLSKALTFYNR